MTSIFRAAMGDAAFERLHPELQRRFSVGLTSGELCVGRGVMDRVWHGRAFVKPFLAVGGLRNILLPRTGRDVPFVIENVPYADSYGRETVTFVRTFALPGGPRRFDATMVHSPERGCVLDYLGTHQHLASDLHLSAEPDGSLLLVSGEHRFREGPLDVRVPELLGAGPRCASPSTSAPAASASTSGWRTGTSGPFSATRDRSPPSTGT